MSGDSFSMGDLVWAKMKGFPPWPGRVSDPPKESKKTPKKSSSQWIYFFGTDNYGWIENSNIKPYHKFKETLTKSNKTVAFREACSAIEEFLERGEGSLRPTPEDAFDSLVKAVPSSPTPAKPKRSKKSDTPKTETPKETSKKEKEKSTEPETPKRGEEPAKSSEKKTASTKKKREGSPTEPVNGESKRSRKEDAVLTLYKGGDKGGEALVKNLTRVVMEGEGAGTFSLGFLGLGIMGSGIVTNLLDNGHRPVLWNRTSGKAEELVGRGASLGRGPADVVRRSDITFSCVSDPQAARELVFGPGGVLAGMDPSKGYVELTTVDADTSLDIADAVRSRGGRYLEAQLQGSKTEAEDGTLVVVCAGDRSLYEDAQPAFQAFGTCSFYLGQAGNAAKMNLVMQLIGGVTLGALAEGMALADRAGLRQADVLEIMSYTGLQSPLLAAKARAIADGLFNTNLPLRHLQKDLSLGLQLGDLLEHPLPLAATANEIYKHARRLGYSAHDASAVYIRARF